MMKTQRRVTNPSALALATALLGWSAVSVLTGAIGNNAEAVVEERPLPVRAVEARLSRGYDIERTFVGKIESRRESDVGFELGGLIAEVMVEEGDEVKSGELLARLDTQLLAARRAELVAEQDRAKADLDLAIKTRRRIDELQSLDFASSQARDEAIEAVNARRADLQRTASAIQTIDVQIAKSELKAPFDALIAARRVDEGQVIAAGTSVLHLLESSQPEARIGVAGRSLDSLAIGDEYTLQVGGRNLVGALRSILPTRDGDTRSTDAVFSLAVPLQSVRSGDLARLRIRQYIAREVITLPRSALTESSRGIWAVYVMEHDAGGAARLARRQVELVHFEGETVHVSGTLSKGERVVTAGLHRLVPGQKVSLITDATE